MKKDLKYLNNHMRCSILLVWYLKGRKTMKENKAKLTKLPSDKEADPIVEIVLPFGYLAAVHSTVILTLKYVPEERLQGFVIALVSVGLAVLFYKAFKASQK